MGLIPTPIDPNPHRGGGGGDGGDGGASPCLIGPLPLSPHPVMRRPNPDMVERHGYYLVITPGVVRSTTG